LPLALAGPAKKKTTTTTVTLAPVSASIQRVPDGPGTIVHTWTTADSPAPVKVTSSIVIPAQPSTTSWSDVFTLHDSSVVQGQPTTVGIVTVSQPKPNPTEVRVTSIVHSASQPASFTTVSVQPSATQAKPKPLGKGIISNTGGKKDDFGDFKLVARADEKRGKGEVGPFQYVDAPLEVYKRVPDIFTPVFGEHAGLLATWHLNNGHLEVKHDDVVKDTLYWSLISDSDLGHSHNSSDKWYQPVLSTNEHKHKLVVANNAKLKHKKDWALVRAEDSNDYTLELKDGHFVGGFIYCRNPKSDQSWHEGATLYWGIDTASDENCESITLHVSAEPVLMSIDSHTAVAVHTFDVRTLY